MNTYILVSKKTVGYLVFAYDDSGLLVHFENCTYKMGAQQKESVLKNLRHCLTEQSFLAWSNEYDFGVIPVAEDLSFERFWTVYDFAKDRIAAENLWKKYSDTDRRYIIYNAMAYQWYRKVNASWYNQVKYPKAFLNATDRPWLGDEYYKMMNKLFIPKVQLEVKTGADSDGASVGELLENLK